MSVSEQPARLAVRSVDDLVGLVPYLIGFHPEESLVAMLLESGRVVVTARVDLDAVAQPGALDALLARLFDRFPHAEGWFLAYTDDDEVAWNVLAECVELVGFVRLGRVLQVGSCEWRADCPDGPVGAITGEVGSVAAAAAVLGLPARASRRDLAAGLAGPPDAEVAGLLEQFEAVGTELEAIGPRGRRRLLRKLLGTKGPVPVDDCVRLALLARRTEGQLAVLRGLARDNADQQLELWAAVVRHCLVDQRPHVLGLVGMAAWQTGDGALQVVCLEELDRIDPAVPIAALLELLNRNVVPPDAWLELRDVLLGLLEAEVTTADRPGSPRGR
ncbi:MAG: DUF4192 domain-containing protein [Propionibacteriaceae bacterium]|nr:DUF4192 domain-containing protein [Propionibacteriaceae bacterium]